MKKVVDVEVVEVDRRSPEVQARSARRRDAMPSVFATSIQDSLEVMEQHARVYERGFEAGIRAANSAMRVRGTREDLVPPDEESTAPYPVVDPLE